MSNKFEEKINYHLNKFPFIKKFIKRIYQLTMYLVLPKLKSEGDIKKVTPNDNYEYFFGYYDKSPWDISDRYMICLRSKNTYKDVTPKEPAEIILIDTLNNNKIKVLSQTSAWNVQQGCMLQWLGPDFSKEIIYNDFLDDKLCSVILNVYSGEKKIIQKPVYSVSKDGKTAITLDFSRLHTFRKGYGYYNIKDDTFNEKCPDETCIWKIDLFENKVTPILKYTDFYNFEYRDEMKASFHKVNHVMLNNSGSRFMVLHRWFYKHRKFTRLLTVNIDGSEMYNLSDDDMTSHCYWKNDNEIIAFLRKKGFGNGYFNLKDKTKAFDQICQNELIGDGHPSISPNGKYIITDTYPDKRRIQKIILINKDKATTIAKVFAPFRYDNNVRCDLHPRWDNCSKSVSFDSVFEGKRAMYIINIEETKIKSNSEKIGR